MEPRPQWLSARMVKHTADWWAERLKELSDTGDVRAVARRHGVRERTLIWWRSELRRRAREKVARPPRLLPVVVQAKSSPVPTARGEGLPDVNYKFPLTTTRIPHPSTSLS